MSTMQLQISGGWIVLCQHAPHLDLTISVAVLYKFAQVMSAALSQASICAHQLYVECKNGIHKKKLGQSE